jgi:hypothetical protein
MSIDIPCAIRDCLKMAKADSKEVAFASRFFLCGDCQMSAVLDVQLSMEQGGDMLPNTTLAYAEIYNGWFRKRQGMSIGHRSGMVTSIKDLEAPIIVRGS